MATQDSPQSTPSKNTPNPSTDGSSSENIGVVAVDPKAFVPESDSEDLQKQRDVILQMAIRACEKGDSRGLQFVFDNSPIKIDLSTLKCTEETKTPLLIACQGGHREIVQYLLKHSHSLSEDLNRNSPLHLAAAAGHTEIACDLLEYASNQNRDACESARSNLFHQLNEKGRSPLGCALLAEEPKLTVAKEFLCYAEGRPENAFPDFAKSVFPKFESRSLDKPVNLFILGDRNVGKSTLICSLQENSSLLAALTNRRTVEGIDKHYTGIIATEFSNSPFQRMICYELAGHTNFFSEKLFESLDALGNSIFIVLVNLKESQPETYSRLVYWLNFLNYYLVRSGAEQKPNTLIVGSHADTRKSFWRSSNRLELTFEDLQKKHPKLAGRFEFFQRPISVDCRKLASFEMRSLRSNLHKLYQKIRPSSAKLPSCMSHILGAVFNSSVFRDQPALTLGELVSKIEENSTHPDLNLCKLLPTEANKLLALCETLHENQRLLLFKNPLKSDIESTWIVHNSHKILTDIDAQLKELNTFVGTSADEDKSRSAFRENFLANSGIISRTTLETTLQAQNFNLDPTLAVQLLQYFKYCELVSISSDTPSSDQYFFLPGLLEDIGEPDPWKGDGFGFAWCIAPSDNQKDVFNFFLPRFLKQLLLSLTQRFVQNPARFNLTDDEHSSSSSAIERSEVGDRAISWLTSDGIHITVFTNDDEIILNMFCSQPDTELSCLQLRNYIVSTIRDQRDHWQPEISTTEFVIPFGEKFPVRKSEHYQSVSLDDIYKAIMTGREDFDGVPLQSVIFHDPCIVLSKLDKLTQILLSDVKNLKMQVSESVLKKMAQIIGSKARSLYSQLQLPSAVISRDHSPLQTQPDVEVEIEDDAPVFEEHPRLDLTHEELLKHFDSFSICKCIKFLKELQEYTPGADTGEDNLEQDNISPLGRQQSEVSTLPKSATSDFVVINNEELPSQLPYINTTRNFTCGSDGIFYSSEHHGIVIKVPPGAVAKSAQQVNVEFGLLMTGPFEFPPECKLVSPILWLSTDLGSKFNKNLEITLPHCIDLYQSDESKNLGLYKCTPNETLSDFPFVFSSASKEQVRFSSSTGNAVVLTKHTGFFCLCYKMPEENMISKTKFSIVSMMPKEEDTGDCNFTIEVYVTLALRTCFQLVVKKHPGCNYVRKNFKFQQPPPGKEAAIEINHERFLRSGWMAALGCFQREILLREASPFNTLDDTSDYPPKFTINISGDNATRGEMFQVSFSGATRPLGSEYFLKYTGAPLSARLSASSMLSLTAPLVPSFFDRHINSIVQLLHMNEISPHLTELKILTAEETTILLEMRSQRTRKIVVEELVNMLKAKGMDGLRKFMTALEQTTDGTGHGDLLKRFREDPDYEQINRFS